MFDLRKDRLDYTADLFRPPDGFHFKRAVATTYSLDLKALLASLLPLVLGEEPDASALKNPLMIWRALKGAAGRIAVFHEEGQIIDPRGVPDRLYALLEQMLVAVQLPDDGGRSFPAFHPKTWAIEFQNDTGETQVRFCVLSRNLTFDRSWDLALSLDGGTDARRAAPRRRDPGGRREGHLGNLQGSALPCRRQSVPGGVDRAVNDGGICYNTHLWTRN